MERFLIALFKCIDVVEAIPYNIAFVLEMAWLYLTWPFELLGFRIRSYLRWRQFRKSMKSWHYYREER